jgi:hypothetical protein
LFNGFNKFIENELKANKEGYTHLDEKIKEELQKNLKLINSNLDKKEREIMQVFDCNPKWPLCLYDFTFKNRNDKYIAMLSRRSLKDYVIQDYIMPNGRVSMNAKHSFKESDDDIVRVQA